MTSVETETLSTYLTEPVDLWKMDTEEAEDQILKDLNETGKFNSLRTHNPIDYCFGQP